MAAYFANNFRVNNFAFSTAALRRDRFPFEIPKGDPKLRAPRASSLQLTCSRAMTDTFERLKAALADRYTIEQEIGAGGMATVYVAHDIKHDRKVALKLLRPELAAMIGAERFLNEIKVTANLHHPHILPLHDSGEADSFLYYVMPFVEGDTLRDKIDREKQLGIEDAIGLTRAVASALDYAHRQGVIHRDIKPENILLHDGQALVADFGIALAVSAAGGTRLTETGLSIGTPHYMSPEQAMGDRELDARSDIYSLGAVLYEMLSGDPPYTGSTAQAIVAQVITEKAPLVTAVRDTVPQHVEASIAKALNRLPADRFASARGFCHCPHHAGFHTSGDNGIPRCDRNRSPVARQVFRRGRRSGGVSRCGVDGKLTVSRGRHSQFVRRRAPGLGADISGGHEKL